MPILKDVFSTYTSLLKIDNLSHPLLVKLREKTPGTYHHSMATANYAFEAAKAIGANSVLTRVGAYYHDVGKIKNPKYFVENQTNKTNNPHKNISPQQSAKIIIKHIIDGINLAQKYKIPSQVIEFIPEHTGTTLVYYFYSLAKKNSKEEVYKRDFRYPGPKPMSKETAIVMLADSVEATLQTQPKFNLIKAEDIINTIIQQKIDDRQLDIAGLQKNETIKIKKAFLRVAEKTNHKRVRYPKRKINNA